MSEKAALGFPSAQTALAQLGLSETLEQAYAAWRAFEAEAAQARQALLDERARLQRQGEFLLGAVKAAVAPSAGSAADPAASTEALALASPQAVGMLVGDAEAKVKAALTELEGREAAAKDEIERVRAQMIGEVEGRVARAAAKVRPAVVCRVRPVGRSGSTIVHLDRVRPDEAVILCHVLTGKIPSRYEFLFDDSTEDPLKPPPQLYPEQGISEAQTRPAPSALTELLARRDPVVPLKGMLPLQVPGPTGTELFRLLMRGPVLEAEKGDGAQFRNVLSADEGQRLVGHLLRLKLEGRIALELIAD